MSRMDGLKALALKTFPDLKPEAQSLLHQLIRDISEGRAFSPTTEAAEGKPEIPADWIKWLCLDSEAVPLVPSSGLLIEGVAVSGSLDLSFACIPFPIAITKSTLSHVSFVATQIPILSLAGSTVSVIRGAAVRIGLQINLSGAVCLEEVTLASADIEGDLLCTGTAFHCPEPTADHPRPTALYAASARIGGRADFSNITTSGPIILIAATIKGDLTCSGTLTPLGPNAILADRIIVEGDVDLKGLSVIGRVSLSRGKIGGNLTVSGSFVPRDGVSLTMDRLQAGGNVVLAGPFSARGVVTLLDTTISGSLHCEGSEFACAKVTAREGALARWTGPIALLADRLEVADNVYFCKGFKATGAVFLRHAQIGGALTCDDAEFHSLHSVQPVDTASQKREVLDAIQVDDASGALRRWNEEYTWAETALDGEGLSSRFVLLGKARCFGNTSLAGAAATKLFVLSDSAPPSGAALDLRFCEAGELFAPRGGWPDAGRLYLDGLHYRKLAFTLPGKMAGTVSASDAIEWLNRQPPTTGRRQPYVQLAEVLKQAGSTDEARGVLVEKQKIHARNSKGLAAWVWRHVLGPAIGYGYHPSTALKPSAVIILFGALVFQASWNAGIMVPTKGTDAYDLTGGRRVLREDYPVFNPLVYSLEMFVPIVNLRVADAYLPNENAGGILLPAHESMKLGDMRVGGIVRLYTWLHICLGWVLTTLWVGGLAGVVKRE